MAIHNPNQPEYSNCFKTVSREEQTKKGQPSNLHGKPCVRVSTQNAGNPIVLPTHLGGSSGWCGAFGLDPETGCGVSSSQVYAEPCKIYKQKNGLQESRPTKSVEPVCGLQPSGPLPIQKSGGGMRAGSIGRGASGCVVMAETQTMGRCGNGHINT